MKQWRGHKVSAMEERLGALDERNRRRKNKVKKEEHGGKIIIKKNREKD